MEKQFAMRAGLASGTGMTRALQLTLLCGAPEAVIV
jgi:hypothetical protein